MTAVKKRGLAIVNRTFGSQAQVIGEMLLLFAKEASVKEPVTVIAQSNKSHADDFFSEKGEDGFKVRAAPAFTDSASGYVARTLETFYFMFWVFLSLCKDMPGRIYISTDPPIFAPFAVMIYCKLFRAKYFYHLQDIHPDAASVIMPINSVLLSFLRSIDNITMKRASALLCPSVEMREFAIARSETQAPIHVLDNAAFAVDVPPARTLGDVVFCGNMGRMQRMPLVMAGIQAYLSQGGRLSFSFIGGGAFASQIMRVAKKSNQLCYYGVLPVAEASRLVAGHRWALLPIQDEVTKFAFPSKSSSYVAAGCAILAICGPETSVAKWIKREEVGFSCCPEEDEIVSALMAIEAESDVNFRASESLRNRILLPNVVEILLGLCEVPGH